MPLHPDDIREQATATVIHCVCGKPTMKRYNLTKDFSRTTGRLPPERLDSALCGDCQLALEFGLKYMEAAKEEMGRILLEANDNLGKVK